MGKVTLIFFFVVISMNSCCPFIKADDLGHNFILSEYDVVDRRILYTNDKCSGSGIEVVPMTVLEYATNSKWIIAKSAKSKFVAEYEYWLIDKEFDTPGTDKVLNVLKSHTSGPLDSVSFVNTLNAQKINLNLNKIEVDRPN